VAHVEERNVYTFVVGKAEGKKLLGRPLSRWEGTIKMILKEWNGRVWTGLCG
jgi:hypothetical protein